ncbi:hypothetical protein ACQPYA_13925 [Micromonospora sp. CA-263727]|uniref:hypothetical protein n=1 Tax=Micromonospora sp. CA-263727 TaxID=3239967 RepID=UPI003D8FC297
MGTEPANDGERELRDACVDGDVVDLTGRADRAVRAGFLESLMTDPAVTIRAVRLRNAVIEGTLDLNSVEISFPVAFEACEFAAAPDLQDARLLRLSLRACRLPGLAAGGLEVQRSVHLDEGFTSTGTVNLVGARVGGSLYLRDARLDARSSADGHALNGSRIRVGGHLSCTNSEIHGQLRLISAKIAGVINLRGTTLSRPGAVCLQGERMEVGEGLWFGSKFRAAGRLLLSHARVDGGVDLAGSTLTEPETMKENDRLPGAAVSLRAVRIRVARNLKCADGFSSTGAIDIESAEVAGTLSFRDAVSCGSGQVVNLAGTSAGTIDLAFKKRPDGTLNLRNTSTKVLIDAPDTWPAVITLDGFRYGRLQAPTEDAPETPVALRLQWLGRSPNGYLPQPYEQLAAVYRAAGQEHEARQVALAKQRARRHKLSIPGRIWGRLMEITVGYGYRTWLAGIWLLGLTVAGATAFELGTPVAAVEKPQGFHSVVYTLDVLLPIADFGQERSWQFVGGLRWLAWGYVVAGWLLTTSVISGVTRVLNRS